MKECDDPEENSNCTFVVRKLLILSSDSYGGEALI